MQAGLRKVQTLRLREFTLLCRVLKELLGHLTALPQHSFILLQANEQISRVFYNSKLPADVTVLRWDRARRGTQRGLVQTPSANT